MDIRFLIEQLDEITRRGFLTGLAATGAAGYYGKQALDKSKEEKRNKNKQLLNVYDIRAGDSKDTVAKLLGKPDKDMDYGVWTGWTYYGPYLDSDVITITFGKSYDTWKTLNGRVVHTEVGSKEIVSMDTAFALVKKEEAEQKEKWEKEWWEKYNTEKNQEPIPGKTEIPGSVLDPKTGAVRKAPSEEPIEETSDEAIARIVELSKK